jgi:AsmA protein
MKKWVWGIAGLLLLLLIVIILLPFLIDLDSHKDRILPIVEKNLNRKVEIGHIGLSLWPGIGVKLKRVRVQDDPSFSHRSFFSMEDLTFRLRLLPLLHRRVEVVSMTLSRPEVVLFENAEGILNVTTIGSPNPSVASTPTSPNASSSGPARLLALLGLDRLEIRHGRVSYFKHSNLQAPSPQYEIKDLDLAVTDLGLNKTAHVKASMEWASSGRVELTAQAGPLTPDLQPKEVSLEVKTGKSDLKLDGGAQRRSWVFNLSSRHLYSEDFSDLAQGSLPPGVNLSGLTGKVELNKDKIAVSSLAANVFGGQVTASGTSRFFPDTRPFQGDLEIKDLQIGQALDALSSTKGILTGTAGMELSLQGSGTDWDTISRNLLGRGTVKIVDGELPKSRLLEQVLTAVQIFGRSSAKPSTSGKDSVTAFSVLDGKFQVQQGNIHWESLNMMAREFDLMARGTVGLDQKLDLQGEMILSDDLTRRVHEGGLAGMLLIKEGRLNVPLRLRGTLDKPSVTVDAKTIEKDSVKKLKKKLFEQLIR